MYVLITVDSIMGRLVLAESGQWTQWVEGTNLPPSAMRMANYATGRLYLQRIAEGDMRYAWVNPADKNLGLCYVGIDAATIAANGRRYADTAVLSQRYAA